MASKITGTAFWQLMDQWQIPDRQALALIDHSPSESGRRPRFALTSEQVERVEVLREIGHIASGLYKDAGAWVQQSKPAAPFRKRSPVAMMAQEGLEGMHAALLHLQKEAMTASLRPQPRPVKGDRK